MDDFHQKRRTKALKKKGTYDKYGGFSSKHLRIKESMCEKYNKIEYNAKNNKYKDNIS